MKKNVVVIFGGDSSEHDVSCLSATTVIKNMDTEKYNVILVGITKEGRWLLVDGVKDIEDGSWREGEVKAFISPDTTTRSLVILAEGTYKLQKVDVIFPVLHGMNGEDGTVQGLFELSKIPYVGCGVLASAVSMDKVYTKIIVDHIGIDQAKFVHVRESDFEHLEEAMDRVEKEIPYPIFVKPSCAGSSKGVSKAENRKELEAALYEAVKHDRNILCEETIVGREVECAVLGDRTQVKVHVLERSLRPKKRHSMILMQNTTMQSLKRLLIQRCQKNLNARSKKMQRQSLELLTDLDYQGLTSS